MLDPCCCWNIDVREAEVAGFVTGGRGEVESDIVAAGPEVGASASCL